MHQSPKPKPPTREGMRRNGQNSRREAARIHGRDPLHPTLAALTYEETRGQPPGGHWAEIRRNWRALAFRSLVHLELLRKHDRATYRSQARLLLTNSRTSAARWTEVEGRLP